MGSVMDVTLLLLLYVRVQLPADGIGYRGDLRTVPRERRLVSVSVGYGRKGGEFERLHPAGPSRSISVTSNVQTVSVLEPQTSVQPHSPVPFVG